MWNHGRKIELKFDGVVRVGISAEVASIFPPRIDVGLRVTGTTFRAARPRAFWIREFGDARAQISHRLFIEWKHTRQRAPLRGHVGDSHASRHRKVRHTVTHEFNRMIKHFILVEEPAQRDDDILAGNAGRKISL